jgi:hypothetical protein
MLENTVVGSDLMPDWEDKFVNVRRELDKQLLRGVREPGKGFSLNELQLIVEHRYTSERLVQPAELDEVVALQQEKWRKVFPKKGELDFSDLVAFPRRAGHDWPILVPKRMSNNRLYAAAEKKFSCWRYTNNLDTIGPAQSFTTLRWFKKVQEADEDLQNLSANMLLERGTPCVWLQERIWMEIDWFEETGDHLDKQNITLVAGSRRSDGGVPRASWFGGGFYVNYGHPDNGDANWRARSAG